MQLRRTDKMLAKPFSTPTRSMSMQCLSSTNESFLSQKTDLIAELKMSKDIHGIKKMKVEKARLEGKYDKDAYSELTRQFTASHFVDQVCATQVRLLPLFFIQNSNCSDFRFFNEIVVNRTLLYKNIGSCVRSTTCRCPKRTMLATSYPIGNVKCWQKRLLNAQRKNSKNEWPKKLKTDACRRYHNGNEIYWPDAKRLNINSSKPKPIPPMHLYAIETHLIEKFAGQRFTRQK